MEKSDFDRLLKQLGPNGRSMLVLGPEFINIDSPEADFTESIQDYLSKRSFAESTQKHYICEDGFLFFDNSELRKKTDVLDKLGDFYRDLPLTESYEQLSRIPFTSIISLSPDDLIVQAYKKINKPHTFCKFKNDGFEDAPQESLKTLPMIYNLMGHHADRHLLIFTFDNLFSFLDKLFQNTGSDNLKKHIRETNSFLFLGFNFRKWYLKLFFYFLTKIREGKNNQVSDAIFNYKNKEDQFQSRIEYYKASYDLMVSPENEKNFIEKLYNACDEKGILSDINAEPEANTGAAGKKAKYRIQFFASSPTKKGQLNSGEKFLSIVDALKGKDYDLFKRLDLKRGDIAIDIGRNKPNMLYFNCHGNGVGELILSKEDNTAEPLPLTDLKEIIDTLLEKNRQINCIVFSACKSEIQAKELSSSIRSCYCIGMNENVDEEVSEFFTMGFIEGLLEDNQNFRYAFKRGVEAIKNCKKEVYRKFHTIPVLYVNGLKYLGKVRDGSTNG